MQGREILLLGLHGGAGKTSMTSLQELRTIDAALTSSFHCQKKMAVILVI
jgi:hypothetical protein